MLSGLVFFLVDSGCPIPAWKTDDPQGRCCYFPFTYLGKTYHSCTIDHWHRPWCSLEPVLPVEGQLYLHWAHCGKKTLIRLEPEKLLSYMYYLVTSTRKLLMRENGSNRNCTLAMTMFIHFVFFKNCLSIFSGRYKLL